MIQIDKKYIEEKGGVLNALAHKSAEYIYGITRYKEAFKADLPDDQLRKLHRLVLHRDPHLDEYFAELLFRAKIPRYKRDILFEELAIFSEDDDANCIERGPNSAVFGIGATATGGAEFLFSFDEHKKDIGRGDASCSQIVVNECFNPDRLPYSLKQVLREVNTIDSQGGAHELHLGNFIKTMHNVRFTFGKTATKTPLRGYLNPTWKRAIINAFISGVLYCIENRIELEADYTEITKVIERTLKVYDKNSPYLNDADYKQAHDIVKNHATNLTGIFRGRFDPKTKQFQIPKGKSQILILPKMIYASELAWGTEITNMLMLHIWELEIQKEIILIKVKREIERLIASGENRIESSIGSIEYQKVKQGAFTGHTVFELCPMPSVFQPNKGVANYINKNLDGKGFIIITDTVNGTKAILKATKVDSTKWREAKQRLQGAEKELWFDPTSSPMREAAFILNGNTTHQYVDRSDIGINEFVTILESVG